MFGWVTTYFMHWHHTLPTWSFVNIIEKTNYFYHYFSHCTWGFVFSQFYLIVLFSQFYLEPYYGKSMEALTWAPHPIISVHYYMLFNSHFKRLSWKQQACTGIILCMCPANERLRYIDCNIISHWRAHTQNAPCMQTTKGDYFYFIGIQGWNQTLVLNQNFSVTYLT